MSNDNDWFEWTVKIRIDPTWVMDGFDLTDERLHDMITSDLQWAYPDEVEGEIVESPDPQRIRKVQGYE